MNFNDRLSNLRKMHKLSREELAKKLGVSYSTVAKYESGTREPDFNTLDNISLLFDVTTDYLLGRSDQPHLSKEEDITYFKNKIAEEFPDIDLMFKDMKSLTAEDMKEVYEYIKFKKSQKEK
ncbi:hypothetical protein CAI16_03070 [Virgibacillus dokdonensis]|uniref:HTH cro/C1-type domain-containing protein n=1 Tax=Virgibacillus dokdonensis TaxID=302167 RepID=A0A3E0WW80_9BACI|nr:MULTISPECIES: helix-turn-helix transcriptional regulator [Virgibacillus]RFA37068.1 hypothetical protein CAI16_03070 [Virgibacillus dokdonensis]